MKWSALAVLCVIASAASFSSDVRAQRQGRPDPTPQSSFGLVPINDLAAGGYMGFTGGLYPGGTNTIPAAHLAAGVALANGVRPLDQDGHPAENGKTVLLA